MSDNVDDLYGHIIVRKRRLGWVYRDDGTAVDPANPRPCKRCQLPVQRGCPDPCIAGLPQTRQACCGHGLHLNPRQDLAGYFALDDGRRVRFSGEKFDGAAVRSMVEGVLMGDPLPEGAVFDEPMWWRGLTKAQYDYVWARLTSPADVDWLVQESLLLA